MSTKFENFYLFDLDPKISNSLELAFFDSSVTEADPSPIVTPATNTPEPVPVPTRFLLQGSCSVCEVGEELAQLERIAHYKSDFHRFNIKRSLQQLSPLSESDFDKLVEEQSIESLSGTETEEDSDESEDEYVRTSREMSKINMAMQHLQVSGNDEDEIDQNTISHLNTKSAFVYFKSPDLPSDKMYGVYKSVFTEGQLNDQPLECLKSFSTQPIKSKKSALFMLGGGHFAGAIISHISKPTKGNPNASKEQAVNVLASKSFHRYTTRRKQGGSQSANDQGKGKAKSAGAMIRRYNEQALTQEIRELMSTWKKELAECESIYIRASGPQQKKIMVGYEGSELANDDSRIRSFPFTTKRATCSELKRAWAELFYLKIVDKPKVDNKQRKKLEAKKQSIQNSQSQQQHEVQITEIPANQKHSTELINLIKKSKAPLLINYMKKNSISPDMLLEPKKQYMHSPTLLHYAASHGLSHMVQILLVNTKADPTLTNESNKTAAELANAGTRKAFQVARYSLGEDYCDWKAAKVGQPMSKEELAQLEKDEQEEIRKEKKSLIKEEMAKKTELELKTPKPSIGGVLGGSTGIDLTNSLNGLSEQQKMRIMREQRARAAEARFKSSA